jgi:hypothetical protein
MRNTEDVTDTSSLSADPLQRNNRAINNKSAMSSEKDHLLSGSVVQHELTPEDKKKKMIKWGIIYGLGFICLVLAIVLPLTLGGGDGPRPDPIGPTPLPKGLMNPYETVVGSESSSPAGYSQTGLLLFHLNETKLWHRHAEKLLPREFLGLSEEGAAETSQIGVDWRNKNFFGLNNDFKRNLTYNLTANSGDQFRLRISTANESRFSIPDEMVPTKNAGLSQRLEKYGLKMYDNAIENFGFQLHDVINPDSWFFDTRN